MAAAPLYVQPPIVAPEPPALPPVSAPPAVFSYSSPAPGDEPEEDIQIHSGRECDDRWLPVGNVLGWIGRLMCVCGRVGDSNIKFLDVLGRVSRISLKPKR